jgi:membrane protein YqaA with SNARE-associated domain
MGEALGTSAAVAVRAARRAWFGPHNRRSLRIAVAGIALLVLVNLLVFLLPIDYQSFGALAYPGVFLITFLANAVTFIPVPYIPVIAHVARSADLVALVVVLGALGSVLGESVAYVVGRVEKRALEEHRFYQRLQAFLAQPFRAGLTLFVLSVPLNPLFDVAGLAAGALGVSYRVFFASVFLGRLARIALIVWVAGALA